MENCSSAAEGADAKAKSQAAWTAFAPGFRHRPLKMSKFTPRERLELVKNEAYWDKARVPRSTGCDAPMPSQRRHRRIAFRSGRLGRKRRRLMRSRKSSSAALPLQANESAACLALQSRASKVALGTNPRSQGGHLCIDREGLKRACLPA